MDRVLSGVTIPSAFFYDFFPLHLCPIVINTREFAAIPECIMGDMYNAAANADTRKIVTIIERTKTDTRHTIADSHRR